MIELKLQINDKKVVVRNIAERWEELSVEQLRVYAETFYPYRKNLFEVEDGEVYVAPDYVDLYHNIRMALLAGLLQLPKNQFLKLSTAAVADMLEHHKLVQFFITSPWVIITNPIAQLVGYSWKGKVLLIGPSIEFHATTLEEFIVADRIYMNYQNDPQEEYLNELMSIFYRPAAAPHERKDKLSSDIRRPFHPDRMDDYLPFIRKQKHWKKVVFLMWYESSRTRMASRFRECFSPSSEDRKGSPDILSQLLGFARNATEFDKVKSLPVYLVMSDAQKGIIANKEAEQRMKNNTNSNGLSFSI